MGYEKLLGRLGRTRKFTGSSTGGGDMHHVVKDKKMFLTYEWENTEKNESENSWFSNTKSRYYSPNIGNSNRICGFSGVTSAQVEKLCKFIRSTRVEII